jgi:cytochrome c
MRKTVLIALAGLLAASAVVAVAQRRGASQLVRDGHEVAENVCSVCHSIAPGEPALLVVSPAPPAFADIANKPTSTARSLKRFITTTHWDQRTLPMTMPDPVLLGEEADQVATYILSLRHGPPPKEAHLGPAATKVDAGEELALRQCSICHVVSDDKRYRPELDRPTPSFAEIANRPSTTAQSLRRFVTTTHWDEKTIPMSMPSQMLDSEETSDVVSYILSLRKKP